MLNQVTARLNKTSTVTAAFDGLGGESIEALAKVLTKMGFKESGRGMWLPVGKGDYIAAAKLLVKVYSALEKLELKKFGAGYAVKDQDGKVRQVDFHLSSSKGTGVYVRVA